MKIVINIFVLKTMVHPVQQDCRFYLFLLLKKEIRAHTIKESNTESFNFLMKCSVSSIFYQSCLKTVKHDIHVLAQVQKMTEKKY